MQEAVGPKRRGRPPTGSAMTSAQRQALYRQRLREGACTRISCSLSAGGARALALLLSDGSTVDAVVNRALQALSGWR